MIKKLLPFVIMAFVSACGMSPDASTKMDCCQHCSCCKGMSCDSCCKDGQCECCKDEACPMCTKNKGTSAGAEGKPCKICDEAEQAWKAKQRHLKH